MDGGMNLTKYALHALSAHEGKNPYKKPPHLEDGWLKRGEHKVTKDILGRPSAFAKVLKGVKMESIPSPSRTQKSPINWDLARVRDTPTSSKSKHILLPKANPIPDLRKWQLYTTKEDAGVRKTKHKKTKHKKTKHKKTKCKKTKCKKTKCKKTKCKKTKCKKTKCKKQNVKN